MHGKIRRGKEKCIYCKLNYFTVICRWFGFEWHIICYVKMSLYGSLRLEQWIMDLDATYWIHALQKLLKGMLQV